MSLAKHHPLTVFFVLAFGLTWAIEIPMEVFNLSAGLQLVLGWMPAIAATVVAVAIGGRPGLRRLLRGILKWRVNAIWYVIALLGVLPIWVGAQVLDPVFGGSGLHLPPLSLGLVAAFVLQLVVRMLISTEEVAWRGFVLPRLQERFTALVSSIMVGGIWGCWHLPLFFVPGSQRDTGFPVFLLGTIGLSVIFTWLFNNTQASVLLCAILHQSINSLTDVLGPSIPTSEVVLFQWMFNALYILVAVILVLVFGPARLTRPIDMESVQRLSRALRSARIRTAGQP